MWSKRCAPRSVHCICCFFTNRLLTTWLSVDSTNAVLILSPCRHESGSFRGCQAALWASASTFGRDAGYHLWNAFSHSPLSTSVRTWSRRSAPRCLHPICWRFTNPLDKKPVDAVNTFTDEVYCIVRIRKSAAPGMKGLKLESNCTVGGVEQMGRDTTL